MKEILLRRRNKLILRKGTSKISYVQHIITLMKNIENLGYTLSKDIYQILLTYTIAELNAFYIELVPKLKKLRGDHIIYQPMYPNFPESVVGADGGELYLNAMIHYWSLGSINPLEKIKTRDPLIAIGNLTILNLGEKEDFLEIIRNLMLSKTSLSQTDKEDLQWFYKTRPYDATYMVDSVPLKENAAIIGALIIENSALTPTTMLKGFFKTATDVLRLSVALSDGDISLAESTKFKSFRRKERRILLELLENCKSIEEDMVKYKKRWIRLGERLHPGEYPQYEKVNAAFAKLRNNIKIQTFRGRVEQAIWAQQYEQALYLLTERPGELARALDDLLRDSWEPEWVVEVFRSVADQVSTPVLLQVKAHFTNRNKGNRHIRVFFPKGNTAKIHSIVNALPDIDECYCKEVASICELTLMDSYKEKGEMGKVYLSENYKHYLVPFSQRSASKTLKIVVRGSRFPMMSESKTLRGFIWWTNMEGKTEEQRVDLDLSAVICDENWNYLEHVSYTKLRSKAYSAYHSGDITNGGSATGKGVAEFLDIDVDSVARYGGRYVVFQVFSYTQQPFASIPKCMFGWMERKKVNSGELFEPKTVVQKMDITTEGTIVLPVIFDCVTREVIWCDLKLSLGSLAKEAGNNNIENNLRGAMAACYGMVNLKKPNLYELVDLHIKARGVRVRDKEEADLIFDIEEGITPFDTDIFMAEYL